MSLKEFILSHRELKDAPEIVFFGGSFNPWHAGHTSCVKLLPPDKKLVILPDHNPYKELVESDGKQKSIEQIKNALRPLERSHFIFDEFLKANRKNPTYYWLRGLKEELPEKDYAFLMGFDTFTGLDKWIEALKLLELLSCIYVASRMDDPSAKKTQTNRLKEIAPRLKIVFLGRHPHEEISSTEIRNMSK